MMPHELSPQERFAFVCEKMATNEEHGQRLYDYASKHWLSLATPILSYGTTKNSLPVSCYLSYMEDTSNGLVDTLSEVNTLSMAGGGVGIGVSIRSADNKSTGVMAHLKIYDASCIAYKQAGVRRGSYAVYLNIDHPDIIPFLEMRKPTGDHNIRCLNLHHGINVTDKFMTLIEKCVHNPEQDDTWELIDPHTYKVVDTISARNLWQRILETRLKTGEPYLCFIDTCNRLMPPFQREKGLKISQSNLCSEIILPTGNDRTAICVLSSLNIEKYDEWKDDVLFVRDVVEMLDNAISIFIRDAPIRIWKAKNSAEKERSIGIGILGKCAYLIKNNVEFESDKALEITRQFMENIKRKIDEANYQLGKLRGEPEDAKGTGRRFCCTMAIAPTASTSIIMGNTSPSGEPYRANVYRQDTLSGSFIVKNKYLDDLIKKKELNKDEIWNEIINNHGSIQHLHQFTTHERNLFKTAFEIDQKWILKHAAVMQNYIDQSQSLNLFLYPIVDVKILHDLHFDAWKLNLKTMYYVRSTKITNVPQEVKYCKYDKKKSIQECHVCE
jgi:ribonucleoside-diphosphate reductase alpha chain